VKQNEPFVTGTPLIDGVKDVVVIIWDVHLRSDQLGLVGEKLAGWIDTALEWGALGLVADDGGVPVSSVLVQNPGASVGGVWRLDVGSWSEDGASGE